MELLIGETFAHYRITAKLGEGGMGEVYRASDTRLEREVAIKVLPAAFTADPERLARFEREAKLLAQLQHPNIAAIYGLEESGGVRALIMELVEGPTLAERLEHGAVPVEEGLGIARQIAEALEAAHEKGIVHRDLKPANIKLTGDGKVKVLDFGLAKALDPQSGVAAADVGRSPTIMNSPTLTAVHGTQLGVILGTAAYMAPEQARGAAVDKRADIWAFGVVLYEMLAGRSLFVGDSVADTLARVLQRPIDFTALPTTTPAAARQLLRRCLERNPKNRLHDIADARLALDDLRSGAADTEAPTPVGDSPRQAALWRRALPWALLTLVGTGWLVTRLATGGEVAGPAPTVLPLDLGDDPIVMSYGAAAVISPDGRRLAWVGGRRSDSWIMVRDLDAADSRRLDGTEGAHDLVFSPDGQELAYFAGTALLKVPLRGGTPQRLAEVGQPRGVTWADDGYVIYNRDVADGLWRVRADGGTPERLTAPDAKQNERSHRWPCAVRGTRSLLFLAQKLGQRYDEAAIEMLDLASGRRTVVHRGGSYPRLTAHGQLLYVRDRALWAASFDAPAGRLTSQPLQVVKPIAYSDWSGGAQFDVADDGTLVYSTGSSDEAVDLSWFDPRSGAFEKVAGDAGFYYTPALANDGHSLALQIYNGGRSDIWIFDLAGGSRRRLTFGGRDENPVWSPDGRSVAFSRIEEGKSRGLAWVRTDGVGEPVAFAPSVNGRLPSSWSAGGALLFTEQAPETHADIWLAWPEQPSRPPQPFLATPANESGAQFSPDGRWVLYQSDESGKDEIYVRPFAGTTGRWQVSEDGGVQPRWSPDGRAIFYWSRAGLCRREVQITGQVFVLGRLAASPIAKPVLPTENSGYVVAKDGRLLLFPFAGEGGPRPRTLMILGWGADLQRRLAGRR